jgi:SAM-dependent methyltransferase
MTDARAMPEPLTLGTAHGRPLRLSGAASELAAAHARQIAQELGSRDVESSMAGHWDLASRIHQWRQLARRVGLQRLRAARCIEIGSGMGLFTLAGRALGFQVAGIEYSSDRYQRSLRVARALCTANDLPVTFIQGRSEELPLPSASVDVVAAFQTFEHVADLAQSLREVRRVLRPGGILFAQAPNYHSFYEGHYGVCAPLPAGKDATRLALRLLGRPTGFVAHLQWLTPAILREQLDAAGFAWHEVGSIASLPPDAPELPIAPAHLPYRFRRGERAQRLAWRLATLSRIVARGSEAYPQIEVWAGVASP